ncbi:uncharacterized protein LOC113003433 isoform X1 [Solenopsis invicta]|uniref:uncharacterized protein LOC113003433 isoform X1 n=1 Tax=Solenopsis invicta TaxID=13686 RepID=UPI00193E2D98|nr:uncharacterized protein LOC113003433 isoform X1 [Solenopsis invicta]
MEEEIIEEFDENDELDDQELITIVKANPFLYDKSDKLYSNSEVKRLAWATVGEGLSKKKTGTDAEHRFWQLRQRFGRERKKVIQSRGRSGAGANEQTYTPHWNLYTELMFLADVIKHRKQVSTSFFLWSIILNHKFIYFYFVLFRTTSNYKRKTTYETTSQTNIPSSLLQVNIPSKLSEVNTPSTYMLNSPLTLSLSSEKVPYISCIDKSSDISEDYSIPQQSYSESAVILPPETNNNIELPAKQMQQVKANTYKKCVPEPDLFAKRRKLNADTFNKSLLDQSKDLNVLAQKVGDAISTCGSQATSHTTDFQNIFSLEIKSMLSSIGFTLQKVPESKQLDCMIAIMQLLKQYIDK